MSSRRKGRQAHAIVEERPELAQIIGMIELPELEPAEVVFCRALIQGVNAFDAYLLAYPAHRAWRKESIMVKASRLRCSEKIKANLGAMMESGMQQFLPTIGQHVGQLVRIRERSITSGQLTAAVTAEVQIGKVGRVYDFDHRDREQIDVTDADLLRAIAEVDPQHARKARQALPAPNVPPRQSSAILDRSAAESAPSRGIPVKPSSNK